jgi:hypothetical protein
MVPHACMMMSSHQERCGLTLGQCVYLLSVSTVLHCSDRHCAAAALPFELCEMKVQLWPKPSHAQPPANITQYHACFFHRFACSLSLCCLAQLCKDIVSLQLHMLMHDE